MIVPKETQVHYPALLDMPYPLLMGYTVETVVAEKIESMVKLGRFNTRMKDFYDLWTIFCRDMLPVENLREAISIVFNNRGTKIGYPESFSIEFTSDRINYWRWKAFLEGLGREGPELGAALEQIRKRLAPYFLD